MQAWLLWLQVWSCGRYLVEGLSPRQWRSIEVDADGKLHGLPRERTLLQHPVHDLTQLLQKLDQDDWSAKLRDVLKPASLLQEVPAESDEIHLEPDMKGGMGAEEFDNNANEDRAPAPSTTVDPEVKQWLDHTHHITQQVKEKTEKLRSIQNFNDGYTFGGDHSQGLSPPAPEPFAPNWAGARTVQAHPAEGDAAARQTLRQLANQLGMSHGAASQSGGERYVEPVPERTPSPLVYAAPTPPPPYIHTVYSGYGPTMAPVVVPVVQQNAYGQERVVPVEVDQGTVRPGQPTAKPTEINGIPVMPQRSFAWGHGGVGHWDHNAGGFGSRGWEMGTTTTTTTTTTAEAVSLTILPFIGLLLGICVVGCGVGFAVSTLMAKKKAKKNGAEEGAGQQESGKNTAQQGPGVQLGGGSYEEAGGYEEASPEEAPFGEDGGSAAAAAAADNTGGLVSSDTSRDPG